MKTPYEASIKTVLAQVGAIGRYDPRHIEAFMRGEHPTLDGLSASRFRDEVKVAMACIDEAGQDFSERIAKSYGF